MQYNYIGSVAERFMRIRALVSGSSETINENLFNSVMVFIPKSIATAQFAADAYAAGDVTKDSFALISMNADNFSKVAAGDLASQFGVIFNGGANLDTTLYAVVFDDTDFAVTVTGSNVSWQPLTDAFNATYFAGAWKFMLDTDYKGGTVTPATDTDPEVITPSHYADLALCLSSLCEAEGNMSVCIVEVHGNIYKKQSGADTADTDAKNKKADTNAIKIASYAASEERAEMETFTGSDAVKRTKFLWGGIKLIGGNNTYVLFHNHGMAFPTVLAGYFSETNDSGQYAGNKIAKIRYMGDQIQPTGNPSVLNTEAYENMGSYIYEKLDAKNVGYFIAIDKSTLNDCELTTERTAGGYPINALMIKGIIGYETSQDIARYRDDVSTRTKPVFADQRTYDKIQEILSSNIAQFGNRLTNISLKFPPLSKVISGNNIKGSGVWSATYTDDLGGVELTGNIAF